MKNLYALVLAAYLLVSCTPESKFIHNQGFVYGTIYSIKYESPKGKDYHKEIEAEFSILNNSLSTFVDTSVISKINQNVPVTPDQHFLNVFKKSMEISKKTGGAFDITVAPMVNAWGFGFKHKDSITTELIDSLKKIVGYHQVHLEGTKIIKKNPATMLDGSAIAKGYTSDVIGELLQKKGCKNYMVEIGGEIVAKGKNSKGKTWTIGISKPIDSLVPNQSDLQDILSLPDKAMATSGNYRNFYIEDGKKYAHTIDPKTGYPVQHSLLSTTVVTNTCMAADAYATAFMVMGLDQSIELSKNIPDMDIYLVYADENGDNATYISEGFKKYLVN